MAAQSSFRIRRLKGGETDTALALVQRVFDEFEAADYGPIGAAQFRRSILDKGYLEALVFYGAFCGKTLVGAAASRSEGRHIALLFVEREFQKKGAGRALFHALCSNCPSDKITVNSSPFAVSAYHAMGFRDTGPECSEGGIRFTPMECDCIGVWAELLESRDSVSACAACERLCGVSQKDSRCYRYFDRFALLLESDNSLVRNRAISLLAANARWDTGDRMSAVMPQLLTHITDSKPITARQCIKSLPAIVSQKPQFRQAVAAALRQADTSRYACSMRPLIEKDIADAIAKL